MPEYRRWTHIFTLLAACGLLAALLAACGSSSSSDTSSESASAQGAESGVPAAVAEIVEKAEEDTNHAVGSTKPIKPEAGKHIVVVTCADFLIGCKEGAEAIVAAGEVLDWDVDVVDGKADPTVWNSAVENAVAEGADGIITTAVAPSAIQGAIASANKAGIPVVNSTLPAVPQDPAKGVAAVAAADYAYSAKVTAAWIAQDSGGAGKVAYFYSPEYAAQAFRDERFFEELSKLCPGCEIVEKVPFSSAQAAQKLAGLTTSVLQKHPDTEYIVYPYDAVQSFLLQGIRQAGMSESVKVVSYEGQADALLRLHEGEINAADMAESQSWAGWIAMDSMARLLNGEKVKAPANPQRLFVQENAPTNGWVPGFDYQAAYEKLWGK